MKKCYVYTYYDNNKEINSKINEELKSLTTKKCEYQRLA